jgi:hypothetical protein
MTRLRFRVVGPALAVPAAVLFAAAVQSAPAPKDKPKETKAEDTVAAEPMDGDQVAQARARARSTNNMKQLGIAFHNYTAANKGSMPADVVDKDGKPLLSWRVLLLPYLEQDALYKQFKLDEPWDSTHNKALLEKMPKTLESPRVTVKKAGYTVYQGFNGPGAVFEAGQKLRFPAAITDGTSNTIFVVEASAGVPWTKPADLPFDPKGDLPEIGKPYNGMPLAGLLDGSVRALNTGKLSADTFKAAITRAGGEVLGGDW